MNNNNIIPENGMIISKESNNNIVNYDDIPIKTSTQNFMELFEKNFVNSQFTIETSSSGNNRFKQKLKNYTTHKSSEINKYSYYSKNCSKNKINKTKGNNSTNNSVSYSINNESVDGKYRVKNIYRINDNNKTMKVQSLRKAFSNKNQFQNQQTPQRNFIVSPDHIGIYNKNKTNINKTNNNNNNIFNKTFSKTLSHESANQNKHLLHSIKHTNKQKQIQNNKCNNDNNSNNLNEITNHSINEFNIRMQQLKEENIKVSNLREEYEKLNLKLQQDKRDLNIKKETQMLQFEELKEEELKKLSKDKLKYQKTIQQLTIQAKKDKDTIEQLQKENTKLLNEIQLKETSIKKSTEHYLRLLEESNSQIIKLTALLSTIKVTNIKENGNTNVNVNVNNNNNDNDKYGLVFPDKYHKVNYTLLNSQTNIDGKIVNYYDNGKKEIIFQSGVKKEVYDDGYLIVYFNNGDIKQEFSGIKTVYYFKETNTVQTTFPDKLQVFKFESGQIEKHFPDGRKEISFPNGSIKYLLPE